MPREFSMVTATGSVRKSLACWWGRRARMLTRILVTILSRGDEVENTTLRANAYLDGVSGWAAGGRAGCVRHAKWPIPLPAGQNQEEADPADDDCQNVKHILPALGLKRLHQEDIEPAGHGEQCRQRIQPHTKRARRLRVARS